GRTGPPVANTGFLISREVRLVFVPFTESPIATTPEWRSLDGSDRMPTVFSREEHGAGEPSQPGLLRSTSPELGCEQNEQDNRQDEQRDPGPGKENRLRPTDGDARDLEELASVQHAKC